MGMEIQKGFQGTSIPRSKYISNLNIKQMDTLTRKLYNRLRAELSLEEFEDYLPYCFFKIDERDRKIASPKRFNTIFSESKNNHSIMDCDEREIIALSKLSGIAASELMYDYGMGMNCKYVSGTVINELVKEEGLQLAFEVASA